MPLPLGRLQISQPYVTSSAGSLMTFAAPMRTSCLSTTRYYYRNNLELYRRAGLAIGVPLAKPRCYTAPTSRRGYELQRDVYFTGTTLRAERPDGGQPPDERKLQLGKTIRTLHPLLPTLLLTPLPQSILSPHITLHLFPSTHPHLPTVSGKLAYNAALWTAPVAWGRIPLVGNVRLTVVSDRMVRHGGTSWRSRAGSGGEGSRGKQDSDVGGDERLIVKWKTRGKTAHRDGTGGVYRGIGLATKDPVEKIRGFIAGATSKETKLEPEEEFCGLFVFEFDDKGRIVKHTIEHTEEGGNADRPGRVVSVADWLLGGFRRRRREEEIELAWCGEKDGRRLQR